jgi:hypothetical protein
LYARRIAPPPPRGLGGNPERKNTPCILDLAGVKFLLKKKGCFSFGALPSITRAVGGAKCGLGFAKTIFWGKDLAKPRLILFLHFVRAEEDPL